MLELHKGNPLNKRYNDSECVTPGVQDLKQAKSFSRCCFIPLVDFTLSHTHTWPSLSVKCLAVLILSNATFNKTIYSTKYLNDAVILYVSVPPLHA